MIYIGLYRATDTPDINHMGTVAISVTAELRLGESTFSGRCVSIAVLPLDSKNACITIDLYKHNMVAAAGYSSRTLWDNLNLNNPET
jgi:hypothetical protein